MADEHGHAHSGGGVGTPVHPGDGHGHGHGHGHDPNLAHHFDMMDQQIESGKLGMWLFLATEVLLFAGLFCFYAIYRATHPEVYKYASQYLNMWMGGLNTLILLASSFTAAAAVTYAQKRDRAKLILCLWLTLAGALGFLVVKFFEYSDKISHGTLWGVHYTPHVGPTHAHHAEHADHGPALVLNPTVDYSTTTPWADRPALKDVSVVKLGENKVDVQAVDGRVTVAPSLPPDEGKKLQSDAHVFFSVYFVMTGTHGLHVVIGMCAIGWVLFRSYRGDFDTGYWLPVDLVALYWHLVDLIWIYLFPLLYLI